jgi:hypothetical protein
VSRGIRASDRGEKGVNLVLGLDAGRAQLDEFRLKTEADFSNGERMAAITATATATVAALHSWWGNRFKPPIHSLQAFRRPSPRVDARPLLV